MVYVLLKIAFALSLASYHGCLSCEIDNANDYLDNINEYRDIISFAEDKPLVLTPYVKAGELSEARKLSVVGDLPNAPLITSYSGFFTVNELYNSNVFFWFVPATNGNRNAPVILWMQGGPGVSGLFGFFVEHGPYFLYPNMTAGLREYAWTSRFHMIYVDNPVGAGFSFTDDDNGYVRTEEQMAENMYEFLEQFFTVFYEYKKNEFYIAGESYGGKYVPALSYKIHKERNTTDFNFKGMAIGNGLCDPETQMTEYGDYLYQIGLADRKQAKLMRSISKSIVKHIRRKEYYKALLEASELIISFNTLPHSSYFKNFTNYEYYYNYLQEKEPADFQYYETYLQNPKVRKALHVGISPFQNGEMAQRGLLMDIMQSVKHQVQVIMDNYRVLFYSGQLDLIIPYPTSLNFLHNLDWRHAHEFKNADRQTWILKDSDTIAGYVHNVKEFYEVLVRDAGHVVPHDKPRAAFELISRFLNRQPFR